MPALTAAQRDSAARRSTDDAATSREAEAGGAPRGEARRAVITEAALAVIARVGPDGLTHRLVAAEAGLPLAATTYWFASKEDMVRAALQHAAERDLEHVAAMRSASRAWTKATVAERLADYVEDACTLRRENAMVDCALWLEALRRPELRPIADHWVESYADVLAEVLRNVGGPGTPDDAELLGAAIDGIVSHRLASDRPFDRAAVTAQLSRLTAALVRSPRKSAKAKDAKTEKARGKAPGAEAKGAGAKKATSGAATRAEAGRRRSKNDKKSVG